MLSGLVRSLVNSLLSSLVASIETFSELSGKLIALLTLVMMGLITSIVIMRYGFDKGSIALQDTVTYLHGSVFMLGAAYSMKHQAHVRVDIFYRSFSPRQKAWIDSLGHVLFLMPLSALLFVLGWEFFIRSWDIQEGSAEPGGLPLVFLLKGLIPLMALSLFLQALADLVKNLCLLTAAHIHKEPLNSTQDSLG